MGKKSRDKSKTGERLLASFLRSEGYECRRGVQYAGGPDSPDVVGLPGIHIECKFVNRLNIHDALKQSIRDAKEGEIPVVFFKRDREDWRVTMQATDFMKIFREYDASMNVPPVDAEPVKHGHWKEDSTCSVCGKKAIKKIIFSGETLWEDKYDYCPHCGAKMDAIEERLIMPKADGSTIPKDYMDEEKDGNK